MGAVPARGEPVAADLQSYQEAALQFDAWLADTDRATDAGTVDRRDVEAWLAFLSTDKSAATAAARYRSLRQFFRCLAEEEDELDASPMASLRPPKVPDQPVPVLTDDQLTALLAACSGKDFNARRDTAIVRTLLDTGGRLSEVANLRRADVDFDLAVLHVMGKGRRGRSVPFGNAARTRHLTPGCEFDVSCPRPRHERAGGSARCGGLARTVPLGRRKQQRALFAARRADARGRACDAINRRYLSSRRLDTSLGSTPAGFALGSSSNSLGLCAGFVVGGAASACQSIYVGVDVAVGKRALVGEGSADPEGAAEADDGESDVGCRGVTSDLAFALGAIDDGL